MNKKWLLRAAEMLELSAGQFSNHGCNDLNWPKDWTQEDINAFGLLAAICNVRGGKPNPDDVELFTIQCGDFITMRTLAYYLRQEASKL